MDMPVKLVDNIFSLVEHQKRCAEKLIKVTEELEERKRACSKAKAVGSSVVVAGAVAVTAAGVLTFFTGGLAAPLLAAAGAVVSGAGLTTNVVTDVVKLIASSANMKDAEKIAKKIEHLEEEIQTLKRRLEKEWKKNPFLSFVYSSAEEYVTEMILRAMGRRGGLILDDHQISLRFLIFALPGFMDKRLITDVWENIVKNIVATTAHESGRGLARMFGRKAARQAAGRIGAGLLGLAFSIPELVRNCKKLKNRETEASKKLRENAAVIQRAAEEMEEQLRKCQKIFRRLAEEKLIIQATQQSNDNRKKLREMTKQQPGCIDTTVWDWLIQYVGTFSSLVEMLQSLMQKIDDAEKNSHDNEVDIILVAHGAIDDSMVPASSLLHEDTIQDVVLYSPWNCAINAAVAHSIATGRIKPRHRKFLCLEERCKIKANHRHRPTNLPDEWNSMKKAGDEMIPNIILSSLRIPEDGAWKRFLFLKKHSGKPGRNRIVIPFIFPKDADVPLSVVCLALSLVLQFFKLRPTLHLAACLGKRGRRMKLDEAALRQQYACTIDHTGMTVDLDPDDVNDLYRSFKAVFG